MNEGQERGVFHIQVRNDPRVLFKQKEPLKERATAFRAVVKDCPVVLSLIKEYNVFI